MTKQFYMYWFYQRNILNLFTRMKLFSTKSEAEFFSSPIQKTKATDFFIDGILPKLTQGRL